MGWQIILLIRQLAFTLPGSHKINARFNTGINSVKLN